MKLEINTALKLYYKQRCRCPICDDYLEIWKLNIDHIIEKSIWWTDCIKNLQITHKKCNSKKGEIKQKMMEEFEKNFKQKIMEKEFVAYFQNNWKEEVKKNIVGDKNIYESAKELFDNEF